MSEENPNLGSSLDSFLKEEKIEKEVDKLADEKISQFSEQEILTKKCDEFYKYLLARKVSEFDFRAIKEFDKNIEFEYAWFVIWIGVGKDWWKITNDYKIILAEKE